MNTRDAEDKYLEAAPENLVQCIYCDGHGKYKSAVCPPCDGAGELAPHELAEWDEERVRAIAEHGYFVVPIPEIKPIDIRPVEIDLCGACGTFVALCQCPRCAECGKVRENDDRVAAGMKCRYCAY